MVIHYLKGKEFGESQDAQKNHLAVSPHISNKNSEHIQQIINQGCPSRLNSEEEYENKHFVLQKVNQQTFLQHPKVTSKT
jgi:hypothetical protein